MLAGQGGASADDLLDEVGGVAGTHRQHVTDPDGAGLGADPLVHLVGEQVDQPVVVGECAIGHRETNRRRGVGLAQRVDQLLVLGTVGIGPSLGDDPAVAKHHQRVQFDVRVLRAGTDEGGEGGRIEVDLAGQGAGEGHRPKTGQR